ncbi:MAG: AgmX/PglI C-terminal domain-containing protein [Enhygromyxa sp.]
MHGNASARDILLLAAEDAFEFERWRDAGPVTADIDPEVKAAEIAEFEALGIPMPAELDSLRRELEHAPKIREAIRHSSLALRRGGRASASALVALGPQQLMPSGGGGVPWGWPMDPRLVAAMDPRFAARMGGLAAGAEAPAPRRRARAVEPFDDDPGEVQAQPSSRSRRVEALVDEGPVEAEVVDDFDDDELDDELDDDFDDEPRPSRTRSRENHRRQRSRRAEPRRARARVRDEWDDDAADDDDFDSMIAARPVRSDQQTTWILGGISIAAVLGLLFFAFKDKGSSANEIAQQQLLLQQQQQQQQQQQAAPVQAPPPPVETVEAALPAEQPPVAAAAPPSSTRRSSGGSAVRSSGSGTASSGSGGLNPFAGFKTEDAAPASTPAAGPTPAPAPAPAPAPTPASNDAATQHPAAPTSGGEANPATTPPPPAEEPKPAEPKPAEEPKPEEPALTKSKMTPAIREAVVGKVSELQACYQDAVVGKPDLAGRVVFTISLDQDGVVKKVEIAKDEVKYGVAKCSAKKIRRWTLPSAGIPIIFDLPFDFKS